MPYEDYIHNTCFCVFDCQCDKVERAIADWTSDEAFEIVKSRLLHLKDPTEIFARLACVLFYREFLDDKIVKCSRDNLKKTSIAFSYACSFANEEIDCMSFYASCWQRFQQLVLELEEILGRIRSRRRFPLLLLIDEIFPQDSEIPCGGATLNSSSAIPTFQAHPQAENSITSNNETRIVRSRAPIRSMPSESAKKRAVKRSASEEDEKKSQTREPMRSTNADSTPTVTNTSPTEIVQQTPLDSEKNKDTKQKKEKIEPTEEVADQIAVPLPTAQTQNVKRTEGQKDGNGHPPKKRVRFASYNHCSAQQTVLHRKQDKDQSRTSSSQQCLSVVTPNPQTNVIDKSNWYNCPKVGCKYTFKFEWMLERHSKHHYGGRTQFPACHECGMDFRAEDALRYHVMVHNKNNRNVCRECDFYYARGCALTNHKIRFHKKQVSQSTSEPVRSM